MKVDDYEVPEDLYYSKDHLWAKVEDGKVRVGITDYAQKELRDIAFVSLPEVGTEVKQFEKFGEIESVKTVAELISPISGKVIEVNASLEDEPDLVNNDPYGEGWMIVVEATNLDEELKNLMNAEAYANYIKELLKQKV
ncbi:MAG: glycine cleavage system protein GcvH [Candidatus Baldrarchaeia archaeon]